MEWGARRGFGGYRGCMNALSYYGKYRGVVIDTNDPMRLGRLRARVPDVPGEDSTAWALPCLPPIASGGPSLVMPAVGSMVWIEFERGDPSYPIWSGCFWTSAGAAPVRIADGPDS